MSRPKDYFVSFGDACSALGILEKDFQLWVRADNPEIGKDYLNRKAIRKSYLESCADKPDYIEKIENSFKAENHEIIMEAVEKSHFYKKECSELLAVYATFIDDLVQLHQRHKNTAEFHGNESSVLAAYLLFSKAISILSCLCDNLKQGYWYVGSMLREIDETLDVALYFIITTEKDCVNLELRKWYRLGFSPPHRKCREVISKWQAQLDPSIEQENHKMLMSSLYGIKSKFIHPTFHSIRDSSVLSISNGEVVIERLCYGKSFRQKRLWELTHFTKSSIWTCFQQFLFIFIDSMPLPQNDIDFLLNYDRKFRELDRKWDW